MTVDTKLPSLMRHAHARPPSDVPLNGQFALRLHSKTQGGAPHKIRRLDDLERTQPRAFRHLTVDGRLSTVYGINWPMAYLPSI